MKANLLILILALLSTSLFSQQCANDSLLTYPPGDINYVGQGFADPDALGCIQGGTYSELVIPFANYNQGARLLTLLDSSTVPVNRTYSVKIENVTSLPSGMCWVVRPSTNAVSGTQIGALIIKGTTSASVGVYPLSVTVSLATQSAGTFNYTGLPPSSYKSLLGQAAIKVSDANGNCPNAN
jgi:hypothetical protein